MFRLFIAFAQSLQYGVNLGIVYSVFLFGFRLNLFGFRLNLFGFRLSCGFFLSFQPVDFGLHKFLIRSGIILDFFEVLNLHFDILSAVLDFMSLKSLAVISGLYALVLAERLGLSVAARYPFLEVGKTHGGHVNPTPILPTFLVVGKIIVFRVACIVEAEHYFMLVKRAVGVVLVHDKHLCTVPTVHVV